MTDTAMLFNTAVTTLQVLLVGLPLSALLLLLSVGLKRKLASARGQLKGGSTGREIE